MKEILKRTIAGTRLEPRIRWLWRRARRLPSSGDRNALYDAQTVHVMKRVIERDSDCIDVGAFEGFFLHQMLDLAPEGHHIAFEPLPHLASKLRLDFPSVEVFEMALADKAGELPFRHVLGVEGYSGFFRRPYDTYEEQVEMISVKVARLDDVVPRSLKPRFIKVDVEGSESKVFRGGLETLRTHRPFVVFESGWDPEENFDALVDGASLQISLLGSWLTGKRPLSREEFLDETLSTRNYCFLAHPAG